MSKKVRRFTFIIPLSLFIISLFSTPFLIVGDQSDTMYPDERAVTNLGYDEDTSAYAGVVDATPAGDEYIVYEHWGGYWTDAE
ncbi:MAG: hypothetical protein ACFFCP_19285, partial [Promethearchaeota archaeon]